MNSRIIAARMPWQQSNALALALFQEKHAVELAVEREDEGCLLGNIYVGSVEKTAPGLQALFVRISRNTVCYLPVSEIGAYAVFKSGRREMPRVGDEILVQINREAQKKKLPSATAELSVSGSYLVLYYGETHISFSSKLSRTQREGLKNKLERILGSCTEKESLSIGIIVRTAADTASERDLAMEMAYLRQQLEQIVKHGVMRNCFSCLYHSSDSVPDLIKRCYPDVSEIVTDDPACYERLTAYAAAHPDQRVRMVWYEDRLLPLYKKWNLEGIFREALCERVALPSGGFLIIQPTEAFVAIDVNTGKQFAGKDSGDAFFLQVNLEAASRIAEQLRIRELSGLILIDFITMKDTRQEEQLLKAFRDMVRDDPVPTVVVDMTPMHIVEVTRKKIRKSLAEQIGGAGYAAE